jgi:hypothetical protein
MSDTTLDLLDEGTSIANANDFVMAKHIAETLHAHYPGQRWAVTCDGRTGLITIRNLWLSGTYGYILKIGEISSVSMLTKDVVRAGGEILERFRMARGRFDEVKYHTMPTDFAGRLEFDRP